MKNFRYNLDKLILVIFAGVSIAMYLKKGFLQEYILLFMATYSMYYIAFEVFRRALLFKDSVEIKSALKNDGYYVPVNAWPLYIISIVLGVLGFAQGLKLIHFSDINNLIVIIVMCAYCLFKNEKCHKKYLSLEKEKEKLISEIGQKEFDRQLKESEEFFKDIEKVFKDHFK